MSRQFLGITLQNIYSSIFIIQLTWDLIFSNALPQVQLGKFFFFLPNWNLYIFWARTLETLKPYSFGSLLGLILEFFLEAKYRGTRSFTSYWILSIRSMWEVLVIGLVYKLKWELSKKCFKHIYFSLFFIPTDVVRYIFQQSKQNIQSRITCG